MTYQLTSTSNLWTSSKPWFRATVRDIDVAIDGKALALYFEPRKEEIVTGKVNTQVLTDATWVKEEPVNGSGPAKEAQHQLDSCRP